MDNGSCAPNARASPDRRPPSRARRPSTWSRRAPRCPSCKAPITALQNVPVLSWLALRGKCANCKAPISARYPLVELPPACSRASSPGTSASAWPALAALAFTWFLIALTFIDFDTQFLPDQLTYPLLWLGLLVSLSHPVWARRRRRRSTPRDSIIGAVAGYLSLWSVYWAFKLLTGKEGMGYGDFKLFAALGAWLGWQMLLPIILFASAVGAVIGIVHPDPRSASGKRHRHRLRTVSRHRRLAGADLRPRPGRPLSFCSPRGLSVGRAGIPRRVSPAASPAARPRSRTCSRRWACPSSTRTCSRARSSRPARRAGRRSPRTSGTDILAAGRQPRPRGAARTSFRGSRGKTAGSRSSRIRPSAQLTDARANAATRPVLHGRHPAAGGNRRRGTLRPRAGGGLRARRCSSPAFRLATASRVGRPQRMLAAQVPRAAAPGGGRRRDPQRRRPRCTCATRWKNCIASTRAAACPTQSARAAT